MGLTKSPPTSYEAFSEYIKIFPQPDGESPEYFSKILDDAISEGKIRTPKLIRIISIGAEGIVCEFRLENTKKAVKICRTPHKNNPTPEKGFNWAYQVSKNLSHDNLILPIEPPYRGSDINKENIIAYRMICGDSNLKEAVITNIASAISNNNEDLEIPRIVQLLKKFATDILSGLMYLHGEDIFHCDIKEENVVYLKEASGADRAAIIDFGCARRIEGGTLSPYTNGGFGTKTHRLCDLQTNSISREELVLNDLFGVSMMLHRFLFLVEKDFGRSIRSHREIRELYILAVLIGGPDSITRCQSNADSFATTPLVDLPSDFCEIFRAKNASEALNLLACSVERITESNILPELSGRSNSKIMAGMEGEVPFSNRIRNITGHPIFRRLKKERQLGWLHEVFPLASHDRWAHSIGVFDIVRRVYLALLNDRYNPITVVCLKPEDISNAMVAALIHDLGQTEFSHTVEEYDGSLYKHETALEKLLDEKLSGHESLKSLILSDWGKSGVTIERVLFISGGKHGDNYDKRNLAVDTLAQDIVSGMIDADRLDYLRRDSHFTNVPYGKAVDLNRLLSSLSIAIPKQSMVHLRLSYHAKGLTAVESLLWARYQMFNSVYWHPTYRAIQAMYAVALEEKSPAVNEDTRKGLFYQYVVLRKSVDSVINFFSKDFLFAIELKKLFTAALDVTEDRALHFVYVVGNDAAKEIVARLTRRSLYKLIFERKVRDHTDGKKMVKQSVPRLLEPKSRKTRSGELAKEFSEALELKFNTKENKSQSEFVAHSEVKHATVPMIAIDFPTRASISKDGRYPFELSNMSRKRGVLQTVSCKNNSVFDDIGKFMFESSCIRIYADPAMQLLITKYLDEEQICTIIEKILPLNIFH